MRRSRGIYPSLPRWVNSLAAKACAPFQQNGCRRLIPWPEAKPRSFIRALRSNPISELSILVLTPLLLSGCGAASFKVPGGGGAAAPVIPQANGLTCAVGSITGAGTDACTVSLNAAAGAGGQSVNLTSNAGVISVPSSVTVAGNATTASFTATASAVNTSQTVTLTAASGGGTATFAISLGAVTPTLTLQSTSVAFGDVPVGIPAYQSVRLTSSGTGELVLSAGSVTGRGFTISGISFPLHLEPGGTATLEIEFDPTDSEVSNGAVTLISDSSSGTTSTINLSGAGVPADSTYEVDLTWKAPSDSSDPVVGFDVYRSVAGGNSYQLLNPAINAGTAYTDSTVSNGNSYTYYVESVDGEGHHSTPSNVFTVTIP